MKLDITAIKAKLTPALAESIKCSKVRIIKYMNDCEELEKKKLIRCRRGDEGVSYRIPREVWNSLLPDLPEEKTTELSGKFDLSGGQIENISRKVEVDAIINGGGLAMDTLLQYCKDEIQNSFSTFKRIGFTA